MSCIALYEERVHYFVRMDLSLVAPVPKGGSDASEQCQKGVVAEFSDYCVFAMHNCRKYTLGPMLSN